MYFLWDASRSIGGVVGYQSEGTIDYCYNYATISYDNPRNESRTLKPQMGAIVGHRKGTVTRYYNNGFVNIGTLHTVKWGLFFSHNQAMYAGNRAFGREG